MAVKKTQIFVGFSTDGRRAGNTQIFDIDLVKQDLKNHFHTRKGERVMLPDYGSIIWDLLFEPFTESLREDVIDDSLNIISQDPRVELQDINVDEYQYGMRLNITLFFRPFEAVDTLSIDFDRRVAERS